jgi:AraC-like DNA-binding protein
MTFADSARAEAVHTDLVDWTRSKAARAGIIRAMWSAAGPPEAAVLPGIVAPDSHVEFVFHLSDTWRMQRAGRTDWMTQPAAFVYAQHRGGLRFAGTHAVSLVAFRVSPVVASRILNRPLNQLWDAPIALEDLLGAEAFTLLEQLHRAGTSERFVILARWVERRLHDWAAEHRAAQRLFERVMWSSPGTTIAELASTLGPSTRSMRRIFAEHSGLSAKAVQLSGRVLDACALLRETSELNIAEIAANVGFHDHAALTHAFTDRIGLTPAQFRAEPHAFYERRSVPPRPA